jgi:hypothetical protein
VHPVGLGKLPKCRSELRLSYSPFFKVLVYTHESVGVFTRTPFFLSCMAYSTFQRMEPLWMPGCGFPGLKGRTNLSLFFLFNYLIALIMNRTIWSTIIPELGGWLGLFTVVSCRFCWLSQFVKRLQIRLVLFFTSQLFLWSVGKQLN